MSITKEDYSVDDLAKFMMYIARCLLIALGGGSGLIKTVKGKSDENPRLMYEGLVTIGAAGVMFAMTFAIANLFK